MDPRQVWLVRLLRVTGLATLTAVVGMVMPAAWMDQLHLYLLGSRIPAGSIVDYLARSTSGLYALLGGILWITATDPGRYRPLIVYLGWGATILGLGVTTLDVLVGMPLLWTLGEGVATILLGLALLVLVRGVTAPPPVR